MRIAEFRGEYFSSVISSRLKSLSMEDFFKTPKLLSSQQNAQKEHLSFVSLTHPKRSAWAEKSS